MSISAVFFKAEDISANPSVLLVASIKFSATWKSSSANTDKILATSGM